MAEWYRRAFDDDAERREPGYELVADGPRQDAVLACREGEVRLGIAPQVRTAEAFLR
jgi:hypothetical protein